MTFTLNYIQGVKYQGVILAICRNSLKIVLRRKFYLLRNSYGSCGRLTIRTHLLSMELVVLDRDSCTCTPLAKKVIKEPRNKDSSDH